MTSEQARMNIILEEIRGMFKALKEGQEAHDQRFEKIETRLISIEQKTDRIPVIEAAIIVQEDLLQNHEQRLSKLEQKAA
jgi:uncharacterized protein (DUF3084 family)